MNYNLLGFIKASKHREEIIKLLGDDLMTPTEISSKLDMHSSQVSRYLAELVDKDLIRILTPELRKGRVYTVTGTGKKYLDALRR